MTCNEKEKEKEKTCIIFNLTPLKRHLYCFHLFFKNSSVYIKYVQKMVNYIINRYQLSVLK